MQERKPRVTYIERPFRGRLRRFQLPLDKIEELEKASGFGIGGLVMRLSSHQFAANEIFDAIRLGLEGGGMSTIEATATILPCRQEPVADYTDLATEIVAAAVYGVDPESEARFSGGTESEGAVA